MHSSSLLAIYTQFTDSSSRTHIAFVLTLYYIIFQHTRVAAPGYETFLMAVRLAMRARASLHASSSSSCLSGHSTSLSLNSFWSAFQSVGSRASSVSPRSSSLPSTREVIAVRISDGGSEDDVVGVASMRTRMSDVDCAEIPILRSESEIWRAHART